MKTEILLFALCSLSVISSDNIHLINNQKDYDDFTKSQNYFLTVCYDLKDKSCYRLAEIFYKVKQRASNELNLNISAGLIEQKINKKLNLNLIYEGFPTIYYFVREGDTVTKEVYMAAKNVEGFLNFLHKRLPLEIKKTDTLDQIKPKKNQIVLVLSNQSAFDSSIVIKAGKSCGIFEIYESAIPSNQLVLITDKKGNQTVELTSSLELLDETSLTNTILLNLRNGHGSFATLSEYDLEFAVGNKPVPTIYYVYEGKKSLTSQIESDISALASKYANDFAFVKSFYNSKLLKKLNFQSNFNFNKTDLPCLILTSENVYNNDDVDKYILTNKEFYMRNVLNSETNQTEIHPLSTSELVEEFIKNFHEGKLRKVVASYDYEESKMDGNNFVSVVNEEIQSDNEVMLLICPYVSKKCKRAKTRVERVFEKLYNANEKKLAIDEFDPLLNEINYVAYEYVPSIVLIKKNPDEFAVNKWNSFNYHGDYTTKDIVQFLKKNSRYAEKETTLEQEDTINWNEAKMNLYPVHKKRFEGSVLPDMPETSSIGLKRKWYRYKKETNSDYGFGFLYTGNEYVDDDMDIEIDDDVDETEYLGDKEDL